MMNTYVEQAHAMMHHLGSGSGQCYEVRRLSYTLHSIIEELTLWSTRRMFGCSLSS